MTLLLVMGGIAGTGHAQQVLSAQSGTIHYTEGKVYVDGRELEVKKSQFATLHPGQELRADDGRAELLLTPGVFLRVTDHSAVRMIDNRLTDTRIEVLEGSILAECDALLKDNTVTLLYSGNSIRLVKHGLYRVDTHPAELRVFDGEAVVESASDQLTVKRGKETSLDSVLVAEKFNRKALDGFDLWDQNRSMKLAYASAGATQSMLNNNYKWNQSGWYFDPYLDYFTFVPYGASVFSPFGWQFWSPAAMAVYYVPGQSWNSGGSAGSVNSSGSTNNSAATSSTRSAVTDRPGSAGSGGLGGAGHATVGAGHAGGFGGRR
jgi:hypothetical protein